MSACIKIDQKQVSKDRNQQVKSIFFSSPKKAHSKKEIKPNSKMFFSIKGNKTGKLNLEKEIVKGQQAYLY